MEEIPGPSLAKLMQTHRWDAGELLDFAEQIVRIIAGMHRAGIIHADIAPSNILISEGGPVLIDFDRAAALGEENPGFMRNLAIASSLAYLAPEQSGRTSHGVDHRADLYSLGVVLYEIAVGRPPFDAKDPLQLLHDHLIRIPTPPAQLEPQFPGGFSDIILRLLEKEPDHRYQSAEGLAYDLASLREAFVCGEQRLTTLGKRDFPLHLSPPSRLIGRDAEIGTLREAFERALRERRRGVFVSGPAGVGKTALMNELRPIVAAEHGWLVEGKFDQYRNDVASGAIFQALRSLGRFLLAEPEAKLAERRGAVLEALDSNAGLIASLVPEISALLGKVPPTPPTDPANAENRLRIALLALLRSVASPGRPIAFVLDDLQWADPTSIRFIEEVLHDESLHGLLLVGAYRDEEPNAAHPLADYLPRWERLGITPLMLPLENLPSEGLIRLLAEMLRLPSEKAQLLAEAVEAHTHGNPYDTVELINELRREGALMLDEEGWRWDDAAVRRSIGCAEIVDLLAARISKLPPMTRELLAILACIGGAVEISCLADAANLDMDALEKAFFPALEVGLLVIESGEQPAFTPDRILRFRHDRAQQAAYAWLGSRRQSLHLEIAQRLSAEQAFEVRAAQQYLAALPLLKTSSESGELKRAIAFFREAASRACRVADYLGAEAFLAGAMELCDALEIGPDDPHRIALAEERHTVLYGLGRYDEADAYYADVERCTDNPVALSSAACRQISALFNRRRLHDAIALGVQMLRRLGREPVFGDAQPDVSADLERFYRWLSDIDLERELERPEPDDPVDIAAMEIMERLQIPSIYGDPVLTNWITFESQRLWASRGPCRSLIPGISMACATLIMLRGDYRTTYDVLRFTLSVAEARNYEPTTSWVRNMFAIFGAHWAEPLEECLPHARRAYEGILRGGDLRQASHGFHATYVALQDSATLEAAASEVEAALAFDLRIGSEETSLSFITHRQMIRALRGETAAPGSLNDASFDEERYQAFLSKKIAPTAAFHLNCAMMGAIFGDFERLTKHADATRSLLKVKTLSIQGVYRPATLGHLLHALATTERLRRGAQGSRREEFLAELDEACYWFSQRAINAPVNYTHLLRFVEAERAWAVGDTASALHAFDVALEEVRRRKRPWHHAFITERAGLCYLENGLKRVGRMLLIEAYRLYEEWGAVGKLRHMEQRYGFQASELSTIHARQRRSDAGGNSLSSGTLDLLSVLRASQALSSKTDLDHLCNSIVELLGAMTGATKVSIALRQGDAQAFVLLPPLDGKAEALPVERAAKAGLLPLSVFRYALRSGEAFMVCNALADDRFAEDPYFKNFEQCSFLAVPISNAGAPLAVLLLENHLSSGAFSEDGLSAVKLIVGQLAVSLNNALLYSSLAQAYEREKRVANTFQEAALDPHLPSIPGLTLDAVYHPGRTDAQVGGDWYDAFRLPDGRVVLSVGDVSGSGLRAAVTMGSVRQSIRTAALINPDPIAILEAVDRIVRAAGQEQFVTAFVGVLDPLFFEFTYANAGHPYPLLRKPDGTVQTLLQNDARGDLPLGLRQRDENASASISVEPGSLLAIYTDGLTEFERDPLTGEKKVSTSLRRLSSLRRPAPELYRSVLGDRVQRDDVAILMISFERMLADMQEEGLAAHWEFDANDAQTAHTSQRAFVSLLEQVGFTAAELSAAELAFGELLGNVVRYAGGRVTIILDLSGESPVLHVLDRGPGFEHNRRLPKDLMSEHGRGLFLVTAFAEDVGISRRKDGGSHARIVLSGKVRARLKHMDDNTPYVARTLAVLREGFSPLV